jgi:hypothetical protein
MMRTISLSLFSNKVKALLAVAVVAAFCGGLAQADCRFRCILASFQGELFVFDPNYDVVVRITTDAAYVSTGYDDFSSWPYCSNPKWVSGDYWVDDWQTPTCSYYDEYVEVQIWESYIESELTVAGTFGIDGCQTCT